VAGLVSINTLWASLRPQAATVRHAGEVPHGCRRPSLVAAATPGGRGLLHLPGSCRTSSAFATTMLSHLWFLFACRVLGSWTTAAKTFGTLEEPLALHLDHGCTDGPSSGDPLHPIGLRPAKRGFPSPEGASVTPRMPQMVTNRFQIQIQGVKSQHSPG
jgi:hypothetical protein